MSEPSVYISLPRGTSIVRPSKHHGLHLQLAQRRSGGIRPGIRDGRGSRSRHGESRRSSRASRPTRRRHVLHERLRLGYGWTFAEGEVEGGKRSASGTLLVSLSRGFLTIFPALVDRRVPAGRSETRVPSGSLLMGNLMPGTRAVTRNIELVRNALITPGVVLGTRSGRLNRKTASNELYDDIFRPPRVFRAHKGLQRS